MKIVKFKFENGHEEEFDIQNPSIPDYYSMYGVASVQNKSTDPEEWMDDYNDWDIDEGNLSKKENGDCISYEIIKQSN